MTDATTTSCAQALAYGWISRFGVPQNITSDRGPQFTSQVWSHLARTLGMQLNFTTSYHPQANGVVERMHRQLKAALMARGSDPAWFQQLPWVLLGIRSAVKDDLGTSAAELIYGEPLHLPGEFVAPKVPRHPAEFLNDLRSTVQSFSPTKMAHHCHPVVHIPHDLKTCQYVFIRVDKHRMPLQAPYIGPYRVVSRKQKTFKIDVGGRTDVISIDRLKPAHVDSSSPVTTPPVIK